MYRVLSCLTNEHNTWLVGVAALVCLATALTTFLMYSIARKRQMMGATTIRLPFVDVQRGPNGTRHYYFRRNKQRWPLRGEPLSEAFLEECRRLLAETERGKG